MNQQTNRWEHNLLGGANKLFCQRDELRDATWTGKWEADELVDDLKDNYNRLSVFFFN